MKVFIDTAPFIYLAENHPVYKSVVEQQLINWIQHGARFGSSTLTLLEVLVVPKREKQRKLVQQYKSLLAELLSEPLIALNDTLAERASEIRSIHQLKTPDSIQLATALEMGFDIFYTNDRRFPELPDLEIVVVK